MSNTKEIKLEIGKFYSEETKIGLQVIQTRYHRVIARDEGYKQRKVFLSEQFAFSHNGEISVNTKGEVEIERFSHKVFSEISEKEYFDKKEEMLQKLNIKLQK